jgi:prepilin-type processing-associated H-X9-DG protein
MEAAPMRNHSRRGFTLFQLLILLALFLIGLALMLPAVAKVREAEARARSQNNMKQIGLAAHNYHSSFNKFPPGLDANNFSAAAQLLPFIEQDAVFKAIDFKKSVDDKANAEIRKVVIKTFLNPFDPVQSVSMDYGATNYLFNAGANADLKDNNGIFFKDSKIRIAEDIPDGTSNTIMTVETLKGDSMVKATDVRRQHVQLKKDALKGLKADAGVEDFKNDKNIAADRCASWMDGRFLQGTITGTRSLNDPRPDVNCGGQGGLSGARGLGKTANVGMCDGSVRGVNDKMSVDTWKIIAGRNDGMVIPNDF